MRSIFHIFLNYFYLYLLFKNFFSFKKFLFKNFFIKFLNKNYQFLFKNFNLNKKYCLELPFSYLIGYDNDEFFFEMQPKGCYFVSLRNFFFKNKSNFFKFFYKKTPRPRDDIPDWHPQKNIQNYFSTINVFLKRNFIFCSLKKPFFSYYTKKSAFIEISLSSGNFFKLIKLFDLYNFFLGKSLLNCLQTIYNKNYKKRLSKLLLKKNLL